MDFITPLLVLSVVALFAGVYYITTSGKRNAESVIDEARARSKKREIERAFADTEPDNDPYRTSLEFNSAMHVTEIDNRVDGYGDLTDEQKNTISLIFDGFKPDAVHEPKKLLKASAHMVAGIPWSQTIFDDANIVESIEASDFWANTRG